MTRGYLRAEAGEAPSRAALVTSALELEMRRLVAAHDAQILRAEGAAAERRYRAFQNGRGE